MDFRLLLQGFDTIECAYYLAPVNDGCLLDYVALAAMRDDLKLSKSRKPKAIRLGCEEFLLASHGTGSGYPLLMENDGFSVQFGEFNKPNFFVKYRSIALWHHGAFELHERFMRWAESVGLQAYKEESLSRVDFAFDYYLPAIDFDEDSFVSDARKDNQHRKNRIVQTFRLGTDQIVLRVYNKCDEITETSHKTWLYELWGMDQEVWRIEWQVRKQAMHLVGIYCFDNLRDRQADLLRLLVKEHTTLRIKTVDSNHSRWPLHPLWDDLIEQVNKMEGLGVVRELDMPALLDTRLARIAISVYGYLKRLGAIGCIKENSDAAYLDEVLDRLKMLVNRVHDPLTWTGDVKRRVDEMRLGEW